MTFPKCSIEFFFFFSILNVCALWFYSLQLIKSGDTFIFVGGKCRVAVHLYIYLSPVLCRSVLFFFLSVFFLSKCILPPKWGGDLGESQAGHHPLRLRVRLGDPVVGRLCTRDRGPVF